MCLALTRKPPFLCYVQFKNRQLVSNTAASSKDGKLFCIQHSFCSKPDFLQEFSSNIFVRTAYLKMQLFIVYFLFRLLNYRYRAKRGEFVQFLTQSRKLNMQILVLYGYCFSASTLKIVQYLKGGNLHIYLECIYFLFCKSVQIKDFFVYVRYSALKTFNNSYTSF